MDYVELVESWVNGNRTTVAREVSKMTPTQVLEFCEVFVGNCGWTEQAHLIVQVRRIVRENMLNALNA